MRSVPILVGAFFCASIAAPGCGGDGGGGSGCSQPSQTRSCADLTSTLEALGYATTTTPYFSGSFPGPPPGTSYCVSATNVVADYFAGDDGSTDAVVSWYESALADQGLSVTPVSVPDGDTCQGTVDFSGSVSGFVTTNLMYRDFAVFEQ